MSTRRVVVDNRSGKWSQPAPLVRAALRESAASEVAAVLMTEVTEPHQAKVLDGIPGYEPLHDLTHGDRDEVAILINTRQVDVLSWASVVLGPDLGPGGRIVGGIATGHLYAVARPCVFAVWHSPASVESDWSGRRADAYRDALHEFRLEVRARRRQVGLDAPVYVGGDWNLNFRRAWVAEYVRSEWPALRVPRLPEEGGSHADRYIDPVLVANVQAARMRHLARSAGNDHRGQRLVSRVRVA